MWEDEDENAHSYLWFDTDSQFKPIHFLPKLTSVSFTEGSLLPLVIENPVFYSNDGGVVEKSKIAIHGRFLTPRKVSSLEDAPNQTVKEVCLNFDLMKGVRNLTRLSLLQGGQMRLSGVKLPTKLITEAGEKFTNPLCPSLPLDSAFEDSSNSDDSDDSGDSDNDINSKDFEDFPTARLTSSQMLLTREKLASLSNFILPAPITHYLRSFSVRPILSRFMINFLMVEFPPSPRLVSSTQIRLRGASNGSLNSHQFISPFLPSLMNWGTRHLEFTFNRKIFIEVSSFELGLLSLVERSRCEIWISKLRNFTRVLGSGFFLSDTIHIIYLSLKFKNPHLMADWLKNTLCKISFWKYRSFFHFLRYIFRFFFWPTFGELSVKGVKFKLKGKISVSGNARTRTISTGAGKNGNGTVENRVLHLSRLIPSFTGVMGFQFWLFF